MSAPDTVGDQRNPDWFGVVLGALVFLGGIAILVFTFYKAAEMFAVPASAQLGNKRDVTQLGTEFAYVLLRIGMLLVMSIVGSIISGKGIRMYLAARARATLHHRESA